MLPTNSGTLALNADLLVIVALSDAHLIRRNPSFDAEGAKQVLACRPRQAAEVNLALTARTRSYATRSMPNGVTSCASSYRS